MTTLPGRSRQNIADGVYLAVLADGSILGGQGGTSGSLQPKIYTVKKNAVKRVKGYSGAYVLFVNSAGTTIVHQEPIIPKTFFLNEQHEL